MMLDTDLFWQGVALFNEREFFDCHEVLEAYWKQQSEPDKQLTQGLIQIAVAYYHVLRENRSGALKLLDRGIPRVERFLPSHAGLSLEAFLTAVREDREKIEQGADNSALIIPKIKVEDELARK